MITIFFLCAIIATIIWCAILDNTIKTTNIDVYKATEILIFSCLLGLMWPVSMSIIIIIISFKEPYTKLKEYINNLIKKYKK